MAMKSPSGEILMTQTGVVIVVGPMVSNEDITRSKRLLNVPEATSPTYASRLHVPKIYLKAGSFEGIDQ